MTVWKRTVTGALALGVASILWMPPQAPAEERESEEDAAETTPVYRPPSLGADAVQLAALPMYVPPFVGRPRVRHSAATRGAVSAPTIGVLAPQDHVALTTELQPTLYWYLGRPTSARIDLILTDASVQPLLDRTLRGPFAAGIHTVRLADYGVKLEPGKSYRWSVSVVRNDRRRSRDIVAEAWIRAAAAPAKLEQRLRSSARDRGVFLYAEGGLWYDAIASVSEQIEAAPHDALLRARRAALLEQVRLSEPAAYDRSQAGMSADRAH